MPKLDDALAEINRGLYADYEKYGVPAEEQAFDTLKNTDTAQSAMKNALKARRLLGEVDERNKSRYGVTGNSAQRNATSRTNQLSTASAEADAGNNAMLADQDTKLRTLQSLMNQGTGIRNAAQSGLGAAAANEQSRSAAHQQAKQAHTGRMSSMLGTGLGLLGMAFI